MTRPAALDRSRRERNPPVMIERALTCIGPHGFHRLAYTEWPGPKAAPVLLCVHGLTRNGRDFDALAVALSSHYRVICPDMPGRGRSDWLADGADYSYAVYLADLTALIARLDVPRIDWLGTSMGGIIGMLFAALPGAPLGKLVINDVGPFIPQAALERIGAYIGRDPSFADLATLEAELRRVHAPFGPLSDGDWRHLATHSARRKPDGSLGLAYDPALALPFQTTPIADVDLWASWDAIKCPVLVIRGAQSDLLLAETAAAMTQRGPRARLAEFAGIGHAPALMAGDQIAAVRDFLLA